MSRLAAAVLTLIAFATTLVVSWPQLFGLELAPGVLHAVAMRGLMAALAAVATIVLVVLAVNSRRARAIARPLAVVALVALGINLAVLSVRGFDDHDATDSDLTVLAWNTLGDEPDAETIADLVADARADVVALPETTEEHAELIAQTLRARGIEMQVLAFALNDLAAASTALLVSEELGEYEFDETAGTTSRLASVVAVPVDGSGPTLAAVHPLAPIMPMLHAWRADLEWVARLCERDDVVVAGDFNATLDHFSSLGREGDLGDCVDAAARMDAAAIGTWPTMLPAVLGTPIDHVMSTPQREPVAFEVVSTLDDAGSDHRPVIASYTSASM